MKPLSPRHKACVEFIAQHVRDKGYPPSIREIGEAVGLSSTSSVYGALEALERKGWIQVVRGQPRSLRLLPIEQVYDRLEPEESPGDAQTPRGTAAPALPGGSEVQPTRGDHRLPIEAFDRVAAALRLIAHAPTDADPLELLRSARRLIDQAIELTHEAA